MGTPHALPQGTPDNGMVLLRQRWLATASVGVGGAASGGCMLASSAAGRDCHACRLELVLNRSLLCSLQVGAAAVGGGALFAVTGGLAAPAIAAGMGR